MGRTENRHYFCRKTYIVHNDNNWNIVHKGGLRGLRGLRGLGLWDFHHVKNVIGKNDSSKF